MIACKQRKKNHVPIWLLTPKNRWIAVFSVLFLLLYVCSFFELVNNNLRSKTLNYEFIEFGFSLVARDWLITI